MKIKTCFFAAALLFGALSLDAAITTSDGLRLIPHDTTETVWVEGTKCLSSSFKYGDVNEVNLTVITTIKDGVYADSILTYGGNIDHVSAGNKCEEDGTTSWVHQDFLVFIGPNIFGDDIHFVWDRAMCEYNLKHIRDEVAEEDMQKML